jgi:hypothetical protein
MTLTLEQKVRALLKQDDVGGAYDGLTRPRGGDLTDFESSLQAWAMLYGIAFGVARMDDPFEPGENVADRAREAAWPAFLRYNGGDLEVPDRDELIGRLLDEYNDAYMAASNRDEVILTPGLRNVLSDLLASGGREAPERKED